jgi:hypothetical protein
MEQELLKRSAVVYQSRIDEIGRTLVSYKRQADGKHGEKKGDDRIIVLWDDAYSGDLKNLVVGFKLTVYVNSEEDGQCVKAE